jgi:SP family sugar:H+ symporter-like MFS transporter
MSGFGLGKWVIWRQRHLFTPKLVFVALYISLASLNFGYDTSLFSSVQGMQPFAKEFGEFDPESEIYVLPSYLSSIMNSTPFLGKLIGTLISGPLMERYGRKIAVLAIALVSIVGVILQCASFHVEQYTIGRILCYLATGITISVVPTYQVEATPAELRGAFVATLQLWIGIGQLIAAVITNATYSMPGRESWLIPTGLQFVVPVVLLVGYPFVPESPRWLLWKDRREEAFRSLRTLRPKKTTEESLNCEIDLITIADNMQQKGTWKSLFQGSNLRRTIIAIGSMFSQQITGQSFVNQYQVVFLQTQGITSPSPFMFNIINTATNFVSSLLVSLVIDTFGRRPILTVGSFFISLWLFVLGALGSVSDRQELNKSQKDAVIACLLLFNKSFGISWAPLAYVIMGEVPTNHLREKTTLLATSISVITTFVSSFTVPYLVNAPYAHLGAKVGYVYGSISACTLLFAIFYVPELKNRSLEELDEMFDAKLSVFQFRKYQTQGIGKEIQEAERGSVKGITTSIYTQEIEPGRV